MRLEMLDLFKAASDPYASPSRSNASADADDARSRLGIVKRLRK
jgi:hypothetical protein